MHFNKASKLRNLIKTRTLVVGVGARDALDAQIIEEAGFDFIWSSSFCISASHGVADASLLSMNQYLEAARSMNEVVEIPVKVLHEDSSMLHTADIFSKNIGSKSSTRFFQRWYSENPIITIGPGSYTLTAMHIEERGYRSDEQDLIVTLDPPADPLILFIYKGADGSFTLYEDEGIKGRHFAFLYLCAQNIVLSNKS